MSPPNPRKLLKPPPNALAIPPDAVCFKSPVNILLDEEVLDPALDGLPNESAVPMGFALRDDDLVVPPRVESRGNAVDDPLSG